MEFTQLAPNGPVLLTPQVFGDERGFFAGNVSPE